MKWSGNFPLFAFGSLVLIIISGSVKADRMDAINAGARSLAGMEVPDGQSSASRSAWKHHAAAMDAQWARYEKSTLKPMGIWGSQEVAPHGGDVVRYLFSGPDILHALRVFPHGRTFVMCGLEPLGVLPELSRLKGRSASASLAQIRKSLEESIRLSFFKTKDMRVDLARSAFPGTIPIMCLFLARSGEEIRHVEFLKLLPDGGLASQGLDAKGANAVRIAFGRDRNLIYFRTNVANGEIEKSGFLKYLQSQEKGGAYLKAASYLLHKSYFSTVRQHLLDYSTVLVEDDSGIPIKHFRGNDWDLSFYGSYTRPIPLFASHYQADLRKAYTRKGNARPLDFGTGYKWRKHQSNLLRAVRRDPSESKVVAIAKAVTPAKVAESSTARRTVPVRKAEPVSVEKSDAQPGPVTVTLKLLAKSSAGDPADVEGGRALGVFDYEVVAVHGGSYPHERIRVAHGIVWNRRQVGAANWEIGRTVALGLVPMSRYPALQRLPLVDSGRPMEGISLYTPRLN